jgi:hypothetical protein
MDRSPDSRRRNISAKRLKRGGNGSPEAAQDWWLEEDKRPLANVDVGAELTTQGIIVRAQNLKLLVEEAPRGI